jgi:hypothetical protein
LVAVWFSPRIIILSRKFIYVIYFGFTPGETHWHGATTRTAMTHIAIQEQLDGSRTTDWMEKVSNEQNQKV